MDPATPTAKLPPDRLAAALADLVGELLPGDGAWPSGRDVGVQHALQMRYLDTRGEDAVPALGAALAAVGLPFDGEAAAARVAAVQALEAAEPALFGWLRDAAYFAYYEAPAVIAHINARGTPLQARPHLKGYDLPRFDRATQTPSHGRGHWIATDAVQRVDPSGLALDSRITANWGLKR